MIQFFFKNLRLVENWLQSPQLYINVYSVVVKMGKGKKKNKRKRKNGQNVNRQEEVKAENEGNSSLRQVEEDWDNDLRSDDETRTNDASWLSMSQDGIGDASTSTFDNSGVSSPDQVNDINSIPDPPNETFESNPTEHNKITIKARM